MDIHEVLSGELKRTGFMWIYGSDDRIVIRSSHGHEYRFEDPQDVLAFLMDINTRDATIDIAEARRMLEIASRDRLSTIPVIESRLNQMVDGVTYLHMEMMVDIPHSDHALICRTTAIAVGEATGTTKSYFLENPNLERSALTGEDFAFSKANRSRDSWISAEDMGFEYCRGYRIFRSESNFVAAHNPSAPEQFVTWVRSWDDAKDAPDFYWGRYTNDYKRVVRDLVERARICLDPIWGKHTSDSVVDISNELFALEDYAAHPLDGFGPHDEGLTVSKENVNEMDLLRYKSHLEGELSAVDEFVTQDKPQVRTVADVSASEYVTPIEGLPNYNVVMHVVSPGFYRVDVSGNPYFSCEKQRHFFLEHPNGDRDKLLVREERSRVLILGEHGINKTPSKNVTKLNEEMER